MRRARSAPDRSAVAPSRGPDQGPHQHRQGMTRMTLGRRRFASLALPLLAAACSSPDPVYYTVATRPGPTFPSGPKIVMLKDIGLASYLDRREIVRSSEGYKLDVMANDWWGESLGGMLGRVLVVELVSAPARQHDLQRKRRHHRGPQRHRRHQPPASRRRQGRHAHPARPGRPSSSTGRGAWRRAPSRSPSRMPTPNMSGLVAAISDAVGELADGIAALLQP